MVLTIDEFTNSTTYDQLNGKPLQGFYSITLHRNQKTDRVEVVFNSTIHVNRAVSPTFCWSFAFTNGEILRDKHLVEWVTQRYGNVWQQHWC